MSQVWYRTLGQDQDPVCPPVPSLPGFVFASAEPASSRTTLGLRHFFFSNLLPRPFPAMG